jgi:exopolysaccharide production protein ExoY
LYHSREPREDAATVPSAIRECAGWSCDATARRRVDAIRVADCFIALVALIFFAPVMLLTGLCICLRDSGPALFAHERIGAGGRSFRCLKFRTMVVDSDARLAELLATDAAAQEEWRRDHKLRRDPRVTAFGRFLRKSSLDELPQLINVLLGEMSLVGPRPIVQAEVTKYGRFFRHYAAVQPGITGLWQVSGRNDVPYRRRVAMDRLYACRRGLLLYVGILLKTVPAVLLRRGSY